jgi:Flp pilus assembly protein CpaB
MKPKTLVLMLVAVGCGLVASFMTSRYLAAQQNRNVVQEEKVPVLVAKHNLSPFSRLKDPEAFEIKQFDKSSVTKDVISDFEKLKGRILKTALAEGKPVAESDLLEVEKSPIEYKLNPGEVAMTIKCSQEGLMGGFLLPGSRVDVVATQIRSTAQGERPFSKVILQNIEVLATNALTQAPENVSNQQIDRVTLRLLHKQAEQVAVFQETGKLCLLLRRDGDTRVYETGPGTEVRGAKALSPDDIEGPKDPQGAPPASIQGPSVPEGTKAEDPVEAEKAKNARLQIYNDSKVTEKEYGTPEEKNDAGKNGKKPAK